MGNWDGSNKNSVNLQLTKYILKHKNVTLVSNLEKKIVGDVPGDNCR